MDYIKVEDCKDGCLYLIMARHARIGIYIKDREGFVICRDVFGMGHLSFEWHWDFDPRKGTVKPFAEIEECPFF